MTLEARPRWDRGFDHLIFNADPRRYLAPALARHGFGGFGRIWGLVHTAWLDIGVALQPFQTGDLFAPLANNLFQDGDFTKQFNQQRCKLRSAQSGQLG